MLRRSLYGKLALALFVVLAALGVIYVGLMVASTRLYLQEVNQSLHRQLAASIAAEDRLIRDNEVNRAALTELFDVLMVVNPAIELYLLDAGGRIIGHAAPPEKKKQKRIPSPEQMDDDFNKLEISIRQLRIQYEMFFAGGRSFYTQAVDDAGDVDALAARIEMRLGGAIDPSDLEPAHQQGQVEGGVGREGDDHVEGPSVVGVSRVEGPAQSGPGR